LLGATPGPIKTVIIAAFGTLIGAWLTSRSQEKRRVVEELRAIHAAFTICFAIVNKGLGIKRQHIRPMKADFDAAVARYDAWMEADPKPPLEFDLDLRTLSKVRFDGPTLERVVFEKCSLGHLGLAAVLSLEDATNDLNTSIEYRNNLISQFQQNPPATELERIILYVGAYGDGKVDERFAHNLEALLHQADDIIFFGMVLSQELLKLERRIRARNRWKYRLGVPKQYPADWTIARNENLIPGREQYADWLWGFAKVPSKWHLFAGWFKQMRADTRAYLASHDAQ
jgi:hypothetical protein